MIILRQDTVGESHGFELPCQLRHERRSRCKQEQSFSNGGGGRVLLRLWRRLFHTPHPRASAVSGLGFLLSRNTPAPAANITTFPCGPSVSSRSLELRIQARK